MLKLFPFCWRRCLQPVRRWRAATMAAMAEAGAAMAEAGAMLAAAGEDIAGGLRSGSTLTRSGARRP